MNSDRRGIGRHYGQLAGATKLGARVDDLGFGTLQLGSVSSSLGQPSIDLPNGLFQLGDSRAETPERCGQLTLSSCQLFQATLELGPRLLQLGDGGDDLFTVWRPRSRRWCACRRLLRRQLREDRLELGTLLIDLAELSVQLLSLTLHLITLRFELGQYAATKSTSSAR